MSESRQTVGRRGKAVAIGVSAAAHGLALFAVLSLRADPAPPPEPPAAWVTLAPPLPRPRQVLPEAMRTASEEPASAPSPAPPAPTPVAARVAPRPPREVTVLPIAGSEAPGQRGDGVSDGELAGAARAGAGGGRPCDMVSRLEAALRRDARVRDAVAGRGRAIRVWDGDWTQSEGQEGRGLAAVREALMWEVGFAPEACRREPVRGLVLLSLGDEPDAGRLVLGAADWRWTDMLTPRGFASRAGQIR